jgi:hypothetical protein
MESWRPFQALRLFLMESKIGDQVALLLGLAPTEIPRNQKGINFTPQCKKENKARKKPSSRLIP